MKLVTYSAKGAQHYGAVVGERVLPLSDKLGQRYPDLKSLIAGNGFAEAEKALKDAPALPLDSVVLEPVIPNPTRILCVGLNYESHRL